jgi:CubicO group peptidase (beta-lactamase class C family)
MASQDRRKFLKTAGILSGAAATLGTGIGSSQADAAENLSEYEWRYGNQMGTRPIEVSNLNNAIADIENGAVYANRHMLELSYVTWNFPPSSDPLSFAERISEIPPANLQHLRETNTDGFIVVKDGEIHHEYYAKGMHVTSKHATYSAGKAWTSATYSNELLQVIDKRVSEVLPELGGTYVGQQTVRSVVDMRVPISWNPNFDDPDSEINRFGAQFGWALNSAEDGLIDFYKSLEPSPDADPNQPADERTWAYVDSNSVLAGMIGRRVAGLHGYMGIKRFYEALGLERISGTVAGFNEDHSAEGGQFFTLRDFVKLPFAMANGGKIKNKQVIAEAYIDDLFIDTPKKRAAWSNGPGPALYPTTLYYTNKWYVLGPDTAMGIGSYGNFIVFNRVKNLAIAKFSTWQKNADIDAAQRDSKFLTELIHTL